jgi:dTDP-glucose pyrophosphorylase
MTPQEIEKFCINKETTILEAISVLNSGDRVVCILDDERNLVGVLTDGDVRRAILGGVPLDGRVERIMNPNPITVCKDYTQNTVGNIFREHKILRIPVLNNKKVVSIIRYEDFLEIPIETSNPVVIMAGGLGTRLHPLTLETPKPLLQINGKPILEIIIESCVKQGFNEFYIMLNYKSEMFIQHFQDKYDSTIKLNFIEEQSRLGTGGALHLLPKFSTPFLVMNGDLLNKIQLSNLVHFHQSSGSSGTMCVKKYDYQVPYGVVETQEDTITGISEKPVHSFFVNAGVYVLSPETIDMVPQNEYFDMPDLFDLLKQKKLITKVFPIHEYWLDIGQMQDFEKAQLDFDLHFKDL